MSERAPQVVLTQLTRLAQRRPQNAPLLVKALEGRVGKMLRGVGRLEDALEILHEVVGEYRRLAADRADVFVPYLAGSLNNLRVRLSELERRDEALAAAREALGHGRNRSPSPSESFHVPVPAWGVRCAPWTDLDRAGSAGFQPARGTKSPLRKSLSVHAWAAPTSRLEAGAPSAIEDVSTRYALPRAGWKPALSEGAGDRLRPSPTRWRDSGSSPAR